MIGKEYQGKKIVGIFSATNHELDGFLKNHSLLKVDGQDQNLSERDKSFLNGEFLSGYVYVSKDCEEEKTNVVNGFVSFLYEIKGNIKEDMDFLNDIDKESLTDALILEYPHPCLINLNIKRIILCFPLFLL